ncbi:hypothetical protein Cgig2_014322 [Carnegiea gigantea]|uniref:Aminotransferase-like plant mobile domain-containing protein n=1 Tax=Carnegiea gigantea TaxID=171969 RepID=A0A9Q1GNM8_9CARY|nr:hypothetical protein Cgig2_014322 [Carnegiea gigantea]
MAALMASGQRISLAPTVLGYIYHGLGDAISDPDLPSKANTIFPRHYVIGWLAELFPCLYRRRPDSVCPGDFPNLVRYGGLLGSKLSLPQARDIFRDGRYLSLRELLLDLLASRERVSQSLSALCSIIDIYSLNTIKICWLSSKIDEIFGVVEAAVKIDELVEVDRVKALSDQDLICSSEIAHIKDQLNILSSKATKLKVKEQEVFKEEERIHKMREDLTIQQQVLLEAGQVEVFSRFEEKGSRTAESGLG